MRELFTQRRLAAIFLFGFASGFPLALTGSTLQAWMTDEKVDLKVIGLFALVGMPYSFKFLWAPIMDRYVPPLFGRRRGWILLTQVALVLAIAVTGFSNPSKAPWLLAGLAVAIAFFSASQDIVIDAYRTEVLPPQELGLGASLNIMGYRIAMLVSGAVALALADIMSWRWVYLAMAGCMALGLLATLFAPEPTVEAKAPKNLKDAVVLPFVEFFKRKGSSEVLAFILLYKLDAVIAAALLTPFLLNLGFTKTEIAAVFKGFGFFATIAGSLAGGAAMVRLGLKKSLWTFGILQGVSGLSLMVLAIVGKSHLMLIVAIAAENFFTGMATSAFVAFMMSVCDKRFTATQYALISSIMALTRYIGGAPSGYLSEALGWPGYFLMSVLVAIPALLLLLRYDKWEALRQTG
jgi:PAT family beta-lactamase induction signal transducer AmpG